jgi:hypothetical protein
MTVEYQHCTTCDATMHPVIWRAHVRSKQHREGLREDVASPRMFARALLSLAAGLIALGYIDAYVGASLVTAAFMVGAVIALVGAVLVAKP